MQKRSATAFQEFASLIGLPLASALLLTGCLTSRTQLRADGGYSDSDEVVGPANVQRVEPKGGYAIDEVKQTHPNVRIDVAPPLDRHPAMVDILLDRARETSCKPA